MAKIQTCCSIGFFIYCLATLLFFGGCLSPYWYRAEFKTESEIIRHLSPFWECRDAKVDYTTENCEWIRFVEMPEWQKKPIVMLMGAGALSVIAGFTSMLLPIASSLQILAGLTGAAGSLYFIIEAQDVVEAEQVPLSYVFKNDPRNAWTWAFFVAVAGSALFTLNGIFLSLVACGNRCSMYPVCCARQPPTMHVRRQNARPAGETDAAMHVRRQNAHPTGETDTPPKSLQPPVYSRSAQV